MPCLTRDPSSRYTEWRKRYSQEIISCVFSFLFILFFFQPPELALNVGNIMLHGETPLLFIPCFSKVPAEPCFFCFFFSSTGDHTPDLILREDLLTSIAGSEPSDTVLSFQRQAFHLGWYAEKPGERLDQPPPEITPWSGLEPRV